MQVYRFVVTGTSEDEALADIQEKKEHMSKNGKQLLWVPPDEDSFEAPRSHELIESDDDEELEEDVSGNGDSEDESMLEENEVEGLLSIDLTGVSNIAPRTTRQGTLFIDLT